MSILRWVITWLYFVCIICFIGAMGGVITHVLFALFFMEKPDYVYFTSFGFMNGLNYGIVWAGGAAIVLCVLRARKEYLATNGREELSNNE